MITTYFTSPLPTKFILIEDTLEDKGKNILDYLIKHHVNYSRLKVNYFVSEGSYVRIKQLFSQCSVHDFVISETLKDIAQTIANLSKPDVIVIDSLSSLITRFGLSNVYKALHAIVNDKRVAQLIAILHVDAVEDPLVASESFEHLATMSLKLQPNSSVSYICKKSSGKILRQMERLRFVDNNLITEPINKLLDAVSFSQDNVSPDNLTTFKISLEEQEKRSRDELVLPYLPKSETTDSSESRIFYKFDHVDDWDEEDPDDDLDI